VDEFKRLLGLDFNFTVVVNDHLHTDFSHSLIPKRDIFTNVKNRRWLPLTPHRGAKDQSTFAQKEDTGKARISTSHRLVDHHQRWGLSLVVKGIVEDNESERR
jgi:hypothetical protein